MDQNKIKICVFLKQLERRPRNNHISMCIKIKKQYTIFYIRKIQYKVEWMFLPCHSIQVQTFRLIMKFRPVLIACFLACTIFGVQSDEDDFEDIFSPEARLRIGQMMLEEYVQKHSEEMQGDAPRPQLVTKHTSSEEIEGTNTEANDYEPISVGKSIHWKEQRYLQGVFDLHQSVICGMPIKKENREIRITTLYYNYGQYKCDENGVFVLKNCIYGTQKVSISKVQETIKTVYSESSGDFIYNSASIGFCSQVAHKYLYSGAPNDKDHIWQTEYLACKENRVDAAYYQYKLVTCKDRKYKLIGCLLDRTFISRKTLRKAQPDVSETHKDVCLHYGNKHNWADSRTIIVGHNTEIDDGMTIEIAKRTKNFHESELCKNTGFSLEFKLSYKFGWYLCGKNELKLLSCLYGNRTIPVPEILRNLRTLRGDYIDDPNDIRFCEQSSGEYLLQEKDSSHEQKTIWMNEDFACHLAKNETSGAGYYNNFKLYFCDKNGQKHFAACMFDLHMASPKDVKDFLQSKGHNWDPSKRDFCYLYGTTVKEIKTHIIVQRGGPGENGRIKDCSKINRWPNNLISYYIAPTEKIYIDKIHDVVKMYENGTCLKFQELKSEPHDSTEYVLIKKTTKSCNSAIGRLNKTKQVLRYDRLQCIIHELGHVIGLVHEHTRPDRDQWVKVDYDQLHSGGKTEDSLRRNYYACNTYHATAYSFDFKSVMMYDTGIEGFVSRIAKYHYKINREKPTSCDYKKINDFYKCSRTYLDRFQCEAPK